MAKNKLSDLNDHLFAQMERLSDEDLKGEKLQEEISRAKSIALISDKIINNSKLAFTVAKAVTAGDVKNVPESLSLKS